MSRANFSPVVNKKAELYLWDQDDGNFLKQADIHASISKEPKPPSSALDYVIRAVTGEGQQLISQKLTAISNVRLSTKLTGLAWKHKSSGGIISSWCFKFKNLEDCKDFQNVWETCLHKTLNYAGSAKAKV